MTDNLRDRIAAVTARLIREEIDIDPVWLVAQHVADAVIAALETDYTLAPKDHHKDKRLFKDGVWGCGESNCKACY